MNIFVIKMRFPVTALNTWCHKRYLAFYNPSEHVSICSVFSNSSEVISYLKTFLAVGVFFFKTSPGNMGIDFEKKRGREREVRKEHRLVAYWWPPVHTPTGNRTRNLLVHGTMLQPPEPHPPGQQLVP